MIKERTLADEVNTVLFYLTLFGCSYAVANYTKGLCIGMAWLPFQKYYSNDKDNKVLYVTCPLANAFYLK